MSFKQIDEVTLKKLHDVELEILKEFIRICNKHNLKYFAVGGTLIGTIRHKGFIPWDDDIDIGMPREDYDKFINIANEEMNKKYFVQAGYDYKNSWQAFTKIRKKDTLADEESITHIDYPKGIFIDIFPFDNTDTLDSTIFKIKYNIIATITDAIYYKWKAKKITEIRRKTLCRFFSMFSNKTLKKVQNKLMKSKNKKETKYFVSYCGSYTRQKETQPKDLFFPLITKKFEDIDILVPNKYDTYLTKVYGDYMKLPPKEKRVNHSMMNISFNTKKDN